MFCLPAKGYKFVVAKAVRKLYDNIDYTDMEKIFLEKEKKKRRISGTVIFNIIVGVMTAAMLIYFIVSEDGVIDLFHSRDGINLWLLAAGLVVFDMNILVDSIVTLIYLRSQYPHTRFLDALKISCVGVFFSAITPSSTGGQPMQLYLMSKMKISVGFGSACMTQKFIVYQFVTMAFSVLAIILNFQHFSIAFQGFWASAFVVLGFLVQLGLTALLLIVCYSERLTGKLLGFVAKLLRKLRVRDSDRKIAKLTREFHMFLDSNRMLAQNKKRMVMIYSLVAVQVLLILSVPFFVYLAFDMPRIASAAGQPVGNWFDFICIQSFVLFTSNLIPLPGASGGAEAAFALYYSGFFMGKTKPAIVAWRFITYYGSIILTAPFSYYTRGHKKAEQEQNQKAEK